VSEPRKYQIDRTRIIFEQFEDEMVLVNTETGYYYSLSNSGSEILRLLEDGCSSADLPTILFGSFEDNHQRRTIVDKFIDQLVAESIISVRASAYPSKTSKEPAPALFDGDFPPPVLERFDDVRDLLLIDPIHQVDQDYGWPRRAGNAN
jgi:Coenzyme PQQ synthesis protein D (PqqD)